MRKSKSSLEIRHERFGYVFILPWIIGVLAFFILPLGESMRYMFNSVQILSGDVQYTFVGLRNLERVFLEDPDNLRLLVESLWNTLFESILIVVFSLIIALMLLKKFPTQTFARMLYMLPIILASGIVLSVFKEDLFSQSVIQGSDTSMFQSFAIRDALYSFGLSEDIVASLTGVVNQLLEIVWRCGVQILLFFASLKSIPPTYYEVSRIEGATGWQTFWNVTFPHLSQFLVLYSVYTVIDSFTYYENPVMQKIMDVYYANQRYELMTVMSVFYSVGVLLVAVIIWLFASRLAGNDRQRKGV